MDINSFISKEEIKKEQEKKAAGGGDADSRFWRIPNLKSSVRLLPRLESKVPWKTAYSHRYNKSGEKIFATCLKTFGKGNCPICKKSWEYHENEVQTVRDLGYEVRATPRYLYNCFIVNDPDKPENNGTVKILSVGKKLHELILESYNSDDLGAAIFDATNGVDFEINRKKSGDNPDFPDYSSSRFVFKKYGVVKTWKEIQDKLINIDDLIKEETPEEMKAKFSHLLNFSDIVSAPQVSIPKTEKKQSKKEVVKEEEEEEIGLEDLEGDNGEQEETGEIDLDDELESALEKL